MGLARRGRRSLLQANRSEGENEGRAQDDGSLPMTGVHGLTPQSHRPNAVITTLITLMDLATCRTPASAVPSSTSTPPTGPCRIVEGMESQITRHGNLTTQQVARQS